MYVCMYVCMHVHMYVRCTYVRLYVHVRMYEGRERQTWEEVWLDKMFKRKTVFRLSLCCFSLSAGLLSIFMLVRLSISMFVCRMSFCQYVILTVYLCVSLPVSLSLPLSLSLSFSLCAFLCLCIFERIPGGILDQ